MSLTVIGEGWRSVRLVVRMMAAYVDLVTAGDKDFFGDNERNLAKFPTRRLVYPDSENDYALLRQSKQPLTVKPSDSVLNGSQRYFNLSIRLTEAFCENVLAHPFTVIKRQCQVHKNSRRYHLLPFSLIPVIVKLQGRQGLGTLWKGIGSVFIVKGLTIVCEDMLSKLTHWPKNVTNHPTFRKLCQHLFLKLMSAAIVSPFYSACLIETVQSDIASEKPGAFDCLAEGVGRLIPRKHSSTSRILSVGTLAIPTGVHGMLHYMVSSMVQYIATSIWRYKKQKDSTDNTTEDLAENGYVELATSFIGSLISDIVLYPCETVLNRLHVQGTRTIIDSLDSGCEVTPIITKYEGPIDCLQSIVDEEGAAGLFKGFGALILQYTLHAAVLGVVKFILIELKRINSKTPLPTK